MKTDRIILDVTRTLVHARKSTPTGIDRVEHAYIRYLLGAQGIGEIWFLANTPFGAGVLAAHEMRTIFAQIERRHIEAKATDSAEHFHSLLDVLARPISTDRSAPLSIRPKRKGDGDSVAAVARAFIRGAWRFRRILRDRKPTAYIHVSHVQLDEPRCFRWLSASHVAPFFFVHDLIPIEYPEFCARGAAHRHAVRINTVLEHAAGILVNSAFTQSSLERYAAGRPVPPTRVVPLANTIRDDRNLDGHCTRMSVPFFIHVGTIEGRKNIGHLLMVWRRLIDVLGADKAPRLVLAGRRGWECETVVSTLDRSRELANHLVEVADLNDDDLHKVMSTASGLITVSATEGYGLPPVEAARLGIPVIASDIPAHREVLGEAGIFVSLHDGEALVRAIIACMGPHDAREQPVVTPPFEWDAHVQQALEGVAEIMAVRSAAPGGA